MIAGSFPLFLLGTVMIGFGNSANQLSRYAAADLYAPGRRASALSLVVWGATVGAVIGPNLVAPAGTLAETAGLPALSGAYLIPILFVGPAALLTFVRLRPDPYQLADTSDTNETRARVRQHVARVAAAPPARPGMRSSPSSPGRS